MQPLHGMQAMLPLGHAVCPQHNLTLYILRLVIRTCMAVISILCCCACHSALALRILLKLALSNKELSSITLLSSLSQNRQLRCHADTVTEETLYCM